MKLLFFRSVTFVVALMLSLAVFAEDEYERVNPKEMKFLFEYAAAGMSLKAGGVVVIKRGEVTHFSLCGKNIALNTKNITPEGFVKTTNYGLIKITPGLGSTDIWLKKNQKKAMKEMCQ